jgi:hypothetical protein
LFVHAGIARVVSSSHLNAAVDHFGMTLVAKFD